MGKPRRPSLRGDAGLPARLWQRSEALTLARASEPRACDA
jgi:hypothetical protein